MPPPPDEGRTVPVRSFWRREWRESLELPGLEIGTREKLEVELFEGELTILLEESAGARASDRQNPEGQTE